MFAVIKTGGKQYRVAAGDEVTIEKLAAEAGEVVTFGEVLMKCHRAGPGGAPPPVAGATVAGEVVKQTRGDKVIVFKKRRRQNSRRRNGHRQWLSVVRITGIEPGAAKA